MTMTIRRESAEIPMVTKENMIDGLKRLEEIMVKAEFRQWGAWLKKVQETLAHWESNERTKADTPFGKLVANPTGDEDMPGICICITEKDGAEDYERPLAVVESIEKVNGVTLRLVAWPDEDFDSCEECMEFLRKE